ncbi:MAG: hypothetical protein WA888_10380 [Burkholderiaceae bacterium]
MNAGAFPVDHRFHVAFSERVVVALALGIVGSVVYGSLRFLFGFQTMMLLASLLATIYVGWLLLRSPVRTGRLVTGSAWLLAVVAMLLINLPLAFHLMALAAMVWLIRALYCYSGILSALADALVVLFAMLAGVWAYFETGSPFLGCWSTFLVLTVFVHLPSRSQLAGWLGSTRSAAGAQGRAAPPQPDDTTGFSTRFERARRAAQSAVEKLSATVG